MVKVRLRRIGKKFNAFYQIVVVDSRTKRDGKFIEQVGYYNPNSKNLFFDVNIWKKWLSVGSQPSEVVKNLFKKYAQSLNNNFSENKIIKLNVLKKTKKSKKQIAKDKKKLSEKNETKEAKPEQKSQDESKS